MNKRAIVLMSFVLFWLAPAQAQLTWQPTGGPDVPWVVDIAERGGALFAATLSAGVFRSTDNGATWTPVNNGLHSLTVTSLVTAPDGTTLLAMLSNIPFRSTDGGASWTRADSGFLAAINRSIQLVFNVGLARAGSAVFVTNGFDAAVTRDNGASWVKGPAGCGTTFCRVLGVAVDNAGRTVIGAEKSVFVSTNGADFVAKTNGLPNEPKAIPVQNPAEPANLFLWVSMSGSGASTTGGGLYRSTDGGDNWISVRAFNFDPDRLSISADGADVYLLSNGSFVRLNLASGTATNFNNRFSDIPRVDEILSMRVAADNSFLLGTDKGLYRADAAQTVLTPSSAGMSGGLPYDMVIDPANNTLVAVMRGQTPQDNAGIGLTRSTDGGSTWTRIGPRDGNNKFLPSGSLFRSRSGALLAGFNNGTVMRSTDNGTTWNTTGLPSSGSTILFSAVQFADGVIDVEGFRSSDDGQNFTRRLDGQVALQGPLIAVAPDDSIYGRSSAGLARLRRNANAFETLTNSAELRLVNLDTVNAQLCSGPTTGATIFNSLDTRNLLITPDGAIYIATDASTNCQFTVFRSVDEGKTFIPVNNGLFVQDGANLKSRVNRPSSLHRGSDNRIYLTSDSIGASNNADAGGHGVFVSEDCGENWTPVGTGLPPQGPAAKPQAVSGNLVLFDRLAAVNRLVSGNGSIFAASREIFEEAGAALHKAILPAPLTTACTFVKPDAFNFTDNPAVQPSTMIESNEITLSNFGGTIKVGVVDGEYSVNGGAYAKTVQMLPAGTRIKVRHTSAPQNNQTRHTRLIAGNISDVFSTTVSNADLTPDAFSFSDSTVDCSAQVTSNEVTITGISAPAPVQVSGGDAEYSVDGGAFTRANGTIANNGKLRLRVKASNRANDPLRISVNVGTVQAQWKVTSNSTNCTATGAPPPPPPPDTMPAPFVFIDENPVALSTQITSRPVSISGFNTPTRIRVDGGEYSIDGGAFTAQPGMVSKDQRVSVRHTSATGGSQAVNTVLCTDFPDPPNPMASYQGVCDTFTSTTRPDADTVPDTFRFTDVNNIATSTVQTSNSVTIAGLGSGVSAPVTVNGGEYSIGSGAFTAADGTVVNGDTVRVRHTAASAANTPTNTTLAVGGVSDTFTSVTSPPPAPLLGAPPPDTTPDTFTFMDQANVARGSVRESNAITVAGVNATTPISVTGGEYSINGGAFTAANGSLANGNTVRVRHTASSNFNRAVTTTLKIGNIDDGFTSVTEAAPQTAGANNATAMGSNSQPVQIVSNRGSLTNVMPTTPTQTPVSGYDYPLGFFAFDITGLTPGETVIVEMQLPPGTAADAYVKCMANSCAVYPQTEVAGDRLLVTLTDNGAGDSDPTPGRIRDPGAPARLNTVTVTAGAAGGSNLLPRGGALDWTCLLTLGLFGALRRGKKPRPA